MKFRYRRQFCWLIVVPGSISFVVDPLEPASSVCGKINAMRSSSASRRKERRILSFMGRTVAELTSKTACDKPRLQEYARNAIWCLHFSSIFRSHWLEEH